MSLPVSQYEALLAEVQGLRRKAQRVQQLARPFIGSSFQQQQQFQHDKPLDDRMESLLLKRQQKERSNSPNCEEGNLNNAEQDHHSSTSEDDEFRLRINKNRSSRSTGQMSVSSEPSRISDSMYHGAWPEVSTKANMWNSEPARLAETSRNQSRRESTNDIHNEVASVMSFASSSGAVPIDRALCSPEQKCSSQKLEAKMDVVNSLISMLGNQEHVDMGETFLALSACPESCLAMRQSGCISLLVQLVQSDKDTDTRRKAAQALHNLVNSQPDEKIRKREIRILKLLEETRRYVECLKYNFEYTPLLLTEPGSPSCSQRENNDNHPVQTIAHIMNLSFDEGHRQAICQLGGIQIIATLVEIENSKHGCTQQDGNCILMRRYACNALTNLTFGDSGNKTLLCSLKGFLRTLIVQLQSPSDELRQVTGSVLRNLSWRADSTSKEILREVGSVTALMQSAMLQSKEITLKPILSALWNLSAHCTENKSEICSVPDGLGFLINMLTYKSPSKSLAIIENAGGILRNISSQIAVREDYRQILRQHNCLHILLDQLKSPSLTVVSNACGTLWNLSAKNARDQETLWEMGAPAMLRRLNHSKHKMIAMGSSAALKNLLSSKPQQNLTEKLDSTALALNLPELPTLGARKQRALLQDLDSNLSETYDNLDKDSPVKSTGAADPSIETVFSTTKKPQSQQISSENLNNAFASLNINEPSTSSRHKSKIPHNNNNYGASSLPPPIGHSTPTTSSFLPVRSKYSDQQHVYEHYNHSELHMDYGRKYSDASVEEDSTRKKIEIEPNKTENYNIGYTETDLDQPTDYSLRYTEDDLPSSDIICDEIRKPEFIQDTVKTYCTEGTPYETPFAFSTATSISDLRDLENVNDDDDNNKPEIIIDNDIQNKINVKIENNKEVKHMDEKDRCSTEDISETESAIPSSIKPEQQQQSEFSSGMMSPEKPVNYCEEGTPGYFSRVSSFGSGLDSMANNIDVNNSNNKKEIKCSISLEVSPSSKQKMESEMESKNNSASKLSQQQQQKVVKFEQVVNYAEETPLMFSRTSSLASLDSVDQHSIHDDRSSIVSDFRTNSLRLASGIISPSELPDSPTQTISSSPRSSSHQKLEYPSAGSSSMKRKSSPKFSVFADNVKTFQEENTPCQFSCATSLSSLIIIDDQNENLLIPSSRKLEENVQIAASSQQVNISTNTGDGIDQQDEKIDDGREKEASGSDLNENSEDEDLLAACISDGIQSTISAPSCATTTKLPMSSTFKYSTGIPVIRRATSPLRNISNLVEDSLKTYCVENTPVEISRTGSISNLSVLSMLDEHQNKSGNLSSDCSSVLSTDDALLRECIESAIPKRTRQDLPVEFVEEANNASGLINNSNILKGSLSAEAVVRIRKESVSSLSSIASNDSDKALLEECINAGIAVIQRTETDNIPKNTTNISSNKLGINTQQSKSSESLKGSLDNNQQKNFQNDTRGHSLPPFLPRKPKPVEKTSSNFPLRTNLSDFAIGRNLQVQHQADNSRNKAANLSSSNILAEDYEHLEKHKRHHQAQNKPSNKSASSKGDFYSFSNPQSIQSQIPHSRVESSSVNYRPIKSVHHHHHQRELERKDSVSSLSSMASNENDKALLDECIYVGISSIRLEADKSKVKSELLKVQPFKHHPFQGVDRRKSNESVKVSSRPTQDDYQFKQPKIDTQPKLIRNNENRGECRRSSRDQRSQIRQTSLPTYFHSMRDEISHYQIEDSPCQFSLRSSLSDLTVDGSEVGLKLSEKSQNLPTVEQNIVGSGCIKKIPNSDTIRLTSRRDHSSLSSSSSVNGELSKEDEALLNECIQAGMTNGKPSQPHRFRNISSMPKNLKITSVPENDGVVVPQIASINVPIQGADVRKDLISDQNEVVVNTEQELKQQDYHQQIIEAKIETDLLQDKLSHSEENLKDQIKNGSSKSISQFLEGSFENDFTYSNSDNNNDFTKSCEESGNLMDNRMLDPDAMIESLDRFTAELVSQASHLNNKDQSINNNDGQLDKTKLSNNDDNTTWNDDDESSQNEITFPTMSGSVPNVVTFDSDKIENNILDLIDGVVENIPEGVISNDFSSTNTTMTESTLIAIEAGKMVNVFKKEAAMSQSTARSLNLDAVINPPLNQFNSLTTSSNVEVGQLSLLKSPKISRKKSQSSSNGLVKRALSNSIIQTTTSSLEMIEGLNPPSEMMNLIDIMDNSISSIASLPPEISNGVEKPHPIFNVKQPFIVSSSSLDLNSLTADLEMINPPSVFNDITDLCNSLADISTTECGTFEDCVTHFPENTLIIGDNLTAEFSDANSVTPIQTDCSSAENTPKRILTKSLNKSMMTKQRRNLARDRYKTYVIAAEKVMQESIEIELKKEKEEDEETAESSGIGSEDYKSVNDADSSTADRSSSLTYKVVKSGKITPKERRKLDRERFQTQVLDTAILKQAESRSPSASPNPSPTRTKLSIRRNFMHKRLENKDRFKTQTLSESSFSSPELLSASPPPPPPPPPPCETNDIHSLVEKEANLVLKTIRDSKLLHDEILDNETLSLVSNDEDSEQNSGGSPLLINRKKVTSTLVSCENLLNNSINKIDVPTNSEINHHHFSSTSSTSDDDDDDDDDFRKNTPIKPKIVKPIIEQQQVRVEEIPPEESKGIRGRRKPLFTKTNNIMNKPSGKTIKPAKSVAPSNIVKNVTSSIKKSSQGVGLRNSLGPKSPSVKSSGYGYISKNRVNNNNNNSPIKKYVAKTASSALERQGTFTKEASLSSPSGSPKKICTNKSQLLPHPPSKIPSFAKQQQIGRTAAATSKIPTNRPPLINNNAPSSSSTMKSLSADRATKISRIYNRSTSADSKGSAKGIQSSSSTQSLKNEAKTGAGVKKSGIPSPAQRSNSNSCISSSNSAIGGICKKQVTSKIASLWKRVEENKAKQNHPVNDKRIWIKNQHKETGDAPKLLQNNYLEKKTTD